MTHLRKQMLEELERRNYSETTTRAYLRTIEDLAKYFHRPPDQVTPEQIREYVAHLFRDCKLVDNTVIQHVGAMRFFFIKVLKKAWPVEETPCFSQLLDAIDDADGNLSPERVPPED